jgi:glycosyltransferase involved in cell wall biosynthesis/tetratricopeptide (TPR) repeat protein
VSTVPHLSVCLIVKNEERHLPQCLDSIRSLADEIVVVDTGSTDGTVEIALSHAARVEHQTWHDDFSRARNAGIEQATGDWILALDADETIAGRDHALIRAAIEESVADAFIVPQRHYLPGTSTVVGWRAGDGGYEEGAPYPGFVDVDCRRLFRRRSWLRFRNPVHEELVSIDPARPLREHRGGWVIHHFGKLGDHAQLRAKGEAYLRIGRTKAQDDPRNPQAHYELGVQYAELAQPEAALEAFERALALAPGFRDAALRVALCHIGLKQYRRALEALRACARTLPQHAAEIALAEGNVHRELGDDGAAAQAFRRALKKAPSFAPASLNLALLYQRQDRAADALRLLDSALQAAPGHAELRLLRARIRRDSGDHAGALADLDAMPGDPRAIRLAARMLAGRRCFADARARLARLGDAWDLERHALAGAVALGLGDLDEAVAQLGRSLEFGASEEAAVNLSVALEARGDRRAALETAANGLRLMPSSDAALARFAHLSTGLHHRVPRRALVVFFYQPHSVPFDGTTPRRQGLGGTESAIVYLAEALARRGHRCVVFNNCDAPATVEGVEYARWETMPVRSVAAPADVLVSVRAWQAAGRARFAPLQIFWTGDAFDQPFLAAFGDQARRAQIDVVMLQSAWQIDTFHAHHGVPLAQILRTTLGTAASAPWPTAGASPSGCRAPSAPRRRRPRLVYASTPFRGLDVLLDVFPRIRAACPDAELEVCSSMSVYGVPADEDRRQFATLYRKAEQPGVTLVGSVPQMELAARLEEARLLAYPNHFAETFCIAAAEAQAAGCPVVTTALGALPETVGGAGICIPGDPRSAAYQQAFVAACVSLLTDEVRWQALSGRAREQAARDYAWPAIAERWETACRAALAGKPLLTSLPAA